LVAATNKYSLAGKSAVVTGAGNGIGRAISLAFGKAGAAVACVDLDAQAAQATAATVAKNGVQALPIHCDVGNEADVEGAAKAILDKFPAIHVLVNGAAGYDPNGTVLDLSLSDWNRVFAVNVGGAFLMSRAILPAMIAAGRRQHYSHRLATWQRGRLAPRGLLRDQGGADPTRQGNGDRSRGAEYPRQFVIAGSGRDRAIDKALW
jgi:NAD(P)-dependent dehydrogenase (short-subunit alcohol dehydrogenase family)